MKRELSRHKRKTRKKINKHVAKSLEPSGETIVPTIRASFRKPSSFRRALSSLFFVNRCSPRGRRGFLFYVGVKSDRGKNCACLFLSLPNESNQLLLSVFVSLKTWNSTGIEPSISRKRAVVSVRR